MPLQDTPGTGTTCFSMNQVNLRPKSLQCHATHASAGGKERSVPFTQHICVDVRSRSLINKKHEQRVVMVLQSASMKNV